MIRRLCLIVSLVLAGSLPVLAQTHDRTHPQGHHEGASHDPVDPQVHAAMHALLGTWTGTISPNNGPAPMHLVAGTDAAGGLTLKLAAESMSVGAASNVALTRNNLQWTQALGDASCVATASVKDITAKPSGKLKGTLACENRKIAFALEKAKE